MRYLYLVMFIGTFNQICMENVVIKQEGKPYNLRKHTVHVQHACPKQRSGKQVKRIKTVKKEEPQDTDTHFLSVISTFIDNNMQVLSDSQRTALKKIMAKEEEQFVQNFLMRSQIKQYLAQPDELSSENRRIIENYLWKAFAHYQEGELEKAHTRNYTLGNYLRASLSFNACTLAAIVALLYPAITQNIFF